MIQARLRQELLNWGKDPEASSGALKVVELLGEAWILELSSVQNTRPGLVEGTVKQSAILFPEREANGACPWGARCFESVHGSVCRIVRLERDDFLSMATADRIRVEMGDCPSNPDMVVKIERGLKRVSGLVAWKTKCRTTSFCWSCGDRGMSGQSEVATSHKVRFIKAAELSIDDVFAEL